MKNKSAVKSVFPYIGEYILYHFLSEHKDTLQKEGFFKDAFGIDEEVKAIHHQIKIVFPKQGISFDGASAIDLGLELSGGRLFPIEVKLGKTGLTKSIVDKRLDTCGTSHEGKKVSGNMLSVLNRNFGADILAASNGVQLHAQISESSTGLLKITDSWAIIIRQKHLNSWAKTGQPNFNRHLKSVSLESVFATTNPDCFNSLVKNILSSDDYFNLWDLK